MRFEHIALHGASGGHTEFYYECAQIEVGGNGNGKPGPMVKIPGLYDSSDPALRFYIYGVPNYPYTNVGKHAVWKGGNAGGGGQPINSVPETSQPVDNQPPANNNGGAAPLWG